MKLSRTRIAIALAALVVTSSGCGLINRIRAKNELNEAAVAYRDAHFEEAEARSRRALQLDPTNKTAPMFIARIVHRQFKKGVNTSENLAKGRDAIELYKKILQTDPKNEEAFKAIADLYGAIKSIEDPYGLHPEDDKQREWILQRAMDKNMDEDKRAEAYIILASKDWHCSNDITDLPANKTTTVDPVTKKGTPSYKKPKEDKDFQAIKLCVARGLEEANKAIELVRNSEPAYAAKASLLLEASKVAEMEGRTADKKELDKQADDARRETERLSQENEKEKKRKEEEAKKAATPPSG